MTSKILSNHFFDKTRHEMLCRGKLRPKMRRSRWALYGANLLSEPLFTLYNFIGFILYKDLGASALEIACLTMLKPLATILSFYWGAGARRLRANVMVSGVLMRLPFLFCFWFDSTWFLIGASVNYMLFYRAGVPAWMELVKRQVGSQAHFSWASALAYLEGVGLSLAMGSLLDEGPGAWRLLFVGAAVVGLLGVAFQGLMKEEVSESRGPVSLTQPWKDAWRLMRERPDFARFQWGFMLAGFGIMLIQPAIPLFCVDHLGVNYTEMAAAVSIAKGLGYVLSTPLWTKGMEKRSIEHVAAWVFVGIGLFPLILSFGGVFWLYVAYFVYGMGQGGSHLVWNWSGPHYSGQQRSLQFTGVNVVMAGLRGAVAPPLGGWLAIGFGPVAPLLAGAVLCAAAAQFLGRKAQRIELEKI